MEIDYEEIESLYSQGKSYGEIADKLDLPIIDVINHLEMLRITGKNISAEGRANNRKDAISDLYIKGKSLEEISKSLGISVQLVKEELLSMGVHYSIDRNKGIEILSKRPETKRRIALKESKYGIETRRKEVARLHDEGKKGKEIAEILGISFDTVLKDITYLIQNGIIETKRTLRRKEVARLYKEGKSIKEISKELGVSISTISKDIEYLVANGFIEHQEGKEKNKKESIQNRREKVLVLYNQGNTLRKIAEELGVSTTTVYNDVLFLKRNGRIEGKEDNEEIPEEKKVNEREEKVNIRIEKVATLYNKGESAEQISKELKIPISIVYDDIKYLGENGIMQIRSENGKQNVEERRSRVAELYKAGKRIKDIANELGIAISTVNSDIQHLKKNGIIQLRAEDKESKTAERRKKVAKLYNSGKILKEIAEELGVAISTVHSDVEYLRKEGRVKERTRESEQVEERITERRTKVAKLYNSGKTLKEIAKEVGISTSTLHLDLQYLNTKGIIQLKKEQEGQTAIKRRNRVAILYNDGKTIKEIAEELGVTVVVIKKDVNYLKVRGIIVSKRDEPRTMNESSSTQGETDNTTAKVKNDRQAMRKLAQKKYYSMMIKSIERFYKRGDIENAIKYLEMLRSEVHFQGEEKEKLDEIMRILQSKNRSSIRENKSKSQRVFEERIMNLYYTELSVQEISRILGCETEDVEAKILELKQKGIIQEDREDEER